MGLSNILVKLEKNKFNIKKTENKDDFAQRCTTLRPLVYSTKYPFKINCIVMISELMCVMYVYGHARFSDDIEEMTGR